MKDSESYKYASYKNRRLISDFFLTLSVILLGLLICSDLTGLVSYFNINLFYAVFIILCLTSLFSFIFEIDCYKINITKIVAWSTFYLIMVLSSLFSYQNIDAAIVKLIALIFFFFLVEDVNPSRIRFIRLLIISFGVFHAFGVVIQIFASGLWSDIYYLITTLLKTRALDVNRAVEFSNYGYITGFTYNPGLTAMYIINGITMLHMTRSSLVKPIYIAINIILLFSLLMTGKRTMGIVAFFAILVYFALYHGITLRKFIIYFIPLTVGMFILYLVLGYMYDSKILYEGYPGIHRVLSSIYGGNNDSSMNGRYSMWQSALMMYKGNEMFGAGWNSFYFKYKNVPHNTYIQVLTELGLVGFISFVFGILASFFYIIKKYLRYRSQEKRDPVILDHYLGIIFFEIIYIIYSITGNTLWDCEMYYMYFLMISLGYNLPSMHVQREQHESFTYFKQRRLLRKR